jgi:hypothetical protein
VASIGLRPSEWRFFYFRGRFHALDKHQTQFISACGIRPLGGAKTFIIDAHTANYPPDVCSQCLLVVGLASVDEEPIEEALARGFLPGRESFGPSGVL